MKLANKNIFIFPLSFVFIFYAHTSSAALRNPFKPSIPLEIIKEPVKPEIKKPIETQKQPVRTKKEPVQSTDPVKPKPPNIIQPTPPPPPPEPVVFPAIKISGVIWNTDRPQAIINDTVVTEGEVIEGMTIEGISKTEIKLFYKGVTRILSL